MRVRLIHWSEGEGRERQLRLASLGYEVEFEAAEGTALFRSIRARPPDAIVIDLTRLPSHGREAGVALRTYKDTRHVPLIFVDGEPGKVDRIRTLLPDATYTSWGRIKTALPKAAARKPTPPVVPASHLSDKPAALKLGFKPGMKVALLGAPPKFTTSLAGVPENVTFSARPDGAALLLCFVRTRAELATRLGSLPSTLGDRSVWFAWPKKASGITSDLNDNVVRDASLAAGLVDYKVCSIDATWSGALFRRRTR
jgi:CheY-like chemotaxis protein